MPVLAIRTADHYNGVSELHGEVSRKMWSKLWPDLPSTRSRSTRSRTACTRASWVAAEMGALFSRYLGPRWTETPDDKAVWARVHEIPDAELWQVHEHRRHRLVQLRARWLRARGRDGAAAERAASTRADEVLDPHALTIGFARRFATYKRAALLFTDLERVKSSLGDAERPVQLVFAGKAHPQDKGGKELIRAIVHASARRGLARQASSSSRTTTCASRARWSRGRRVAEHAAPSARGERHERDEGRRERRAQRERPRRMVRRGVARSRLEIGWAIGRGEEYTDASGDAVEAELLYDLLEREVVPLFFAREGMGELPARVDQADEELPSRSSCRSTTRRGWCGSTPTRFYVPAIKLTRKLTDGDLAAAKALAAWKDRVRSAWQGVAVDDVRIASSAEVAVGEPVKVDALVRLGALTPEDVAVELYHGPTGGGHEIDRGKIVRMHAVERAGDGGWRYAGEIPTQESGAHAFAARVVPYNDAMSHPYETSLIRWA